MKWQIVALIIYLGLIGCQSADSAFVEQHPLASTECQERGTIVRDRLEESSRGYGYDFQVYLPPCYETEIGRGYPVLYLIPGLGGGTGDWFHAGADEVADEMIGNGRILPFLIIHTENNNADPHSEIIFNDLLPYVENHYHVLGSRQYRAAAGASRGGIGAYRLVLPHPDYFASAGIFGSGLVSGEEEQLQSWLQNIPPDFRPRFFFNTGEQDPLMLDRALVMITLLEEADIEVSQLFTTGEHSYDYWVSNLAAYFVWMAEGWADNQQSVPFWSRG